MVKIEKIIFGFMAVFAAVVAYAMDWQRDQDEQMAGFRELIIQQKTLLEMQQTFQKRSLTNEPAAPVYIPETSIYGYGSSPFFNFDGASSFQDLPE